MATSSSDESCSAPTDFDFTSLGDSSSGQYSLSWERCPLCDKSRRSYYCKDCLRNGEFVHSPSNRLREKFIDKKIRLFELSRYRLEILDRVSRAHEPITKAEKLKCEIAACREKIELLRQVIKETRESSAHAEYVVEQNGVHIEKRRKTHTLYAQKIEKMKQHGAAMVNTMHERHAWMAGHRATVKKMVAARVINLEQFIFPIKRVCPDESTEDSLTEDTINALAEATRTAYVKGRWIYTDNAGDVQFRVVESLLPGNGDYSAYSAWVASNKELVPTATSELCHRSTACAISAALTFLCQFVSVAASFLDVHLPKRLCYGEFCSHELSKPDFANKVAKLNANVLHLCLSQGVDPDHLNPRHTAANLQLLLNPDMCDLGRCGVFEVNADILKSMEESLLQDLDSGGFSDDDEWQDEMLSLADWDTTADTRLLPGRVTASAMPTIAQQRPPRHALPSEAATSVASGLVMSAAASVVSVWRAVIGHRT